MEMREFSEMDWDCFSGVDSEKPMIGEAGDIMVIRDGLRVDIYYDDSEESIDYFRMFDCVEDAVIFIDRHLSEKTDQTDLRLFNFRTV